MPERIYKLQPDRMLSLRGFDDLGAAAALHSATPQSFTVSGVFRDAADFAVLILHDADNFYEHPRLKHLPDFDFTGLTLQFDVHYSGLMPLDSTKYATIDWPYLDVIREDETRAQIRLYDPDPSKSHAEPLLGDHACASCSFTLQDNGLKEYDRLSLWYQNLVFDYLVPKLECAFPFTSAGTGTIHTVTVAGVLYSYTEREGDSNTAVAQGVIGALAVCPQVSASQDSVAANQVNLRAKLDDGIAFEVTAHGTSYTLTGVGAGSVAREIQRQIQAVNWTAPGAPPVPIRAEVSGARLQVISKVPGDDGNTLAMYALWKNERLRTDKDSVSFTGGNSDITWRVTLNFSELGVSRIRQMWLTFAPPLANGAAFADLEWEAAFTNWTLIGPEQTTALRVAAPGSVRVEENSSACAYDGSWVDEMGFYSGGTARRGSGSNTAVTIRYYCASVHDLYVGTTLYRDCGTASVSLDGVAVTSLNCRLDAGDAVNTRRKIRAQVPPGDHTVSIRLAGDGWFHFDFLEAAIPGDVPDPLPANSNVSPALDYSTDHTYKLPPARIHWIFERLGFTAPMNEYIGVFWWNQRRRLGGQMPQISIGFEGTFAAGDDIFLKLGGAGNSYELGKTVFPADTNATIARHFAQLLNSQSVAVWAVAEGSTLTITCRSAKAAYKVPVSIRKVSPSSSTGAWSTSGSLEIGESGTWIVDTGQDPPLNRAARDWHRDMFQECARRGREIVVATSMELVNPPEGFASVFCDGKPVITDVGFASLKSTHCAFTSQVLAYQKAVYACLAGAMAAASLRPNLQCGEYLWWFFTNRTATNPSGGMGYYHPSIQSTAQGTLGRELIGFVSPLDDPAVNGYADAAFLRALLRDHVQAIIAHVRNSHPDAKFEVLFPYDVNHPQAAGIHSLGGRLNRFVNFPAEWGNPATSGFDRLKMEALDFGAWSRNLDLAITAIRFPLDLGWPASQVRHLVPVFRPGYAWEKEVDYALAAGIPVVNLWAYDHVCIFGWLLTPRSKGRSSFMG